MSIQSNFATLAGKVDNTGNVPLNGVAQGVVGILGVANGGSGTATSTGTGNLVLADSPTLTGTPLAPTASNGTNTTQLATTAFVQAALQIMYPVGSIYSSTVATNPATLFGFGTWTAYAAGRVLVGTNGGTFAAGDTGGSADAAIVDHTHSFAATSGIESNLHTHIISIHDEGHSHTLTLADGYGWSYPYRGTGGTVQSGYGGVASNTTGITSTAGNQTTNHTHTVSGTTGATGSSGVGANLQPYVVVYMWNRIA